jgi:uncharacterized membrane protein (DUF106 family)
MTDQAPAKIPWLQNAFYTVTLIITVSGIMLGAYWNILQTLNAQQVTLAGYEARLTVAEKNLQNRQDSEDRFASEMRTALQQIQLGVADLRVQEAQRSGKR